MEIAHENSTYFLLHKNPIALLFRRTSYISRTAKGTTIYRTPVKQRIA